MDRKRTLALALTLALLCACAPEPSLPEPTAPPERLTWLHGFYAGSSYGQIDLADSMDAVSLGWGRMYVDDAGAPYVNTTSAQGNTWVVPRSPHLATDHFQRQGVPYNLCVYAAGGQTYGQGTLADYLLAPAVQDAAAGALVEAAEAYSGLTLDVEGLGSAALAGPYADFVALVRKKLAPDKLLYVAVQPRAWFRGYDYRALGRVCDKVILMAHDYQWQRAPEENLGSALTDTPPAPIAAVEQALKDVTDPATGVEDLSKVALAVSFSSAGVEVDEEGLLLDTRIYSPGPETLAARLAQPDAQPGWSEEYASPYVYYHDEEGRRYRVWYEDARSVEAKIRLAYRYGVTGLSLWRLGTVPNFETYDVWSAVTAQRHGPGPDTESLQPDALR